MKPVSILLLIAFALSLSPLSAQNVRRRSEESATRNERREQRSVESNRNRERVKTERQDRQSQRTPTREARKSSDVRSNREHRNSTRNNHNRNDVRVKNRYIGGRNVNVNVNVHNYYKRVNVLPPQARVVHYHGNPYHYHGGVYYRPWRNSYVICRPPVGAVIAATAITTAFVAITVNAITKANATPKPAQTYYYDDGTYYSKKGNEYEVVEPPVGAIVSALPSGVEEFVIEGKTYYKVDDTLYKPINDGFEVVGKAV